MRALVMAAVIGTLPLIGACEATGRGERPDDSTHADDGDVRVIDGIILEPGMPYDEFVAKNGPPTRTWGSGVTWYVYELSDGRELSLFFAYDSDRGDPLSYAELKSPDGSEETLIEWAPTD